MKNLKYYVVSAVSLRSTLAFDLRTNKDESVLKTLVSMNDGEKGRADC